MITVLFELEKETPGTFRFSEVTKEEPVVGTLYVKKWAFSDGAPATLLVTIEEKS